MDWDHLRIFLAVARHGQLLAAARKLGLNHATVARRLDQLEDALGTRLFDRRPAGSVLTQAGEELLPRAELIEAQMLTLSDAARVSGQAIAGTVRIGAPDGLGSYFLAAELGRLAQIHPALTIELVPLPRTFSLSRREADLAICLDAPTEGRLIVSRLSDYTLSVYASPDYLSRHGEPATLEDVSGHTVVAGVEDFVYAAALDYSDVLAKRAGSLFRCASVTGQVEAVAAGVGIGILHDFAVRKSQQLVRILPETAFRRSYHLVAHADSHDLARVAVCRDFIVERFRANRRRFVHDVAKLVK